MKTTSALLVLALSVSSSALLAGCADENDPKTWVSRLDDASKRAAAVKRLGQFFEDTMTKANGDRNDASVKALLDTIAEPMAKVYATGGGDEKTRRELLKILSDLQDARTAPAFARAFQDYEPGRNDDEVKNATAAIVAMAKKGQALDPALLDATFSLFAKFKPSKAKLAGAFKGLHDAVLEIKSPSWGAKAGELLAAPVDDNPDSKLDEIMFRQLTAVQLLGDLKEASAVPALVKVILTPSKRDLRATASTALLKIGGPAEGALAGALAGKDAQWVALQERWPNRSWVPAVAEAATMLGRPAIRTEALALVASEQNLTNKALLAQFLYRFAPNAEALAAYKEAVEKTPEDATLEGDASGNARATMLASATYFYDPSLVDWVVKLSASAQKAVAKKNAEQLTTLAVETDTAMKLMTKSQLAAVQTLAKSTDDAMTALAGVKGVRGATMQGKYDAAAAVVTQCDEKVECYLAELAKPVTTGRPESAMRAVKAATMVGVLGAAEGTKNAAALAKAIATQADPSARLASVEAIDFLTPKGSADLAATLEQLVESETKAGQKNLAHDAMAKVAMRLRARL